MAHPLATKKRFIGIYQNNGRKLMAACREVGIDAKTGRKWLREYEENPESFIETGKAKNLPDDIDERLEMIEDRAFERALRGIDDLPSDRAIKVALEARSLRKQRQKERDTLSTQEAAQQRPPASEILDGLFKNIGLGRDRSAFSDEITRQLEEEQKPQPPTKETPDDAD